MSPGVPAKIIAASMGLAAFAVAILAGLAAGNPAETVLLRAIFAMLACHAAGWIVGVVGERAVDERLHAYRAEHPLQPVQSPNEPPAGVAAAGRARVV